MPPPSLPLPLHDVRMSGPRQTNTYTCRFIAFKDTCQGAKAITTASYMKGFLLVEAGSPPDGPPVNGLVPFSDETELREAGELSPCCVDWRRLQHGG